MISLEVEQVCLLELIKASLFGCSPIIPKDADWEKIFEAAKVQCIVPLVSFCVPADYNKEWIRLSCQCKAHYMHVLYEQNYLVEILRNSNISFFVFKGTAAAVYYPNPSLRTFGDIDFFVPEGKFDAAKSLLEHNGYRFIDNNDRHYEYEKNGISFELHNRISRQGSLDINHIVLNDINDVIECSVNNFKFPCLSTYKNGLILLWHIAHHLKTSGIGYRQIIDWMMFVHKELDDSAWYNKFCLLAREAGLEKLAITVTYMCKKWFGLPNDISWCDAADEVVADRLLIRCLDVGNFGCDRLPADVVQESIKEEGVFKFLQRAGMFNWPLAQKYALFRPFAWLYQLFRYLCQGIVGFFRGRKMISKNKNEMSLDELWERLEE